MALPRIAKAQKISRSKANTQNTQQGEPGGAAIPGGRFSFFRFSLVFFGFSSGFRNLVLLRALDIEVRMPY